MAYRTNLNTRDKSGAVVAVVAVHVAIAFALLNMSGKLPIPVAQSALKMFNVAPPPPPPPPPPQRQTQPKPRLAQGAAAPKNIKSKATPIKREFPRIALPVPVPVNSSATPRTGTQPTQGASTPGIGTGAGGLGTGNGGGAGGNGAGGGGGGVAEPPHLVSPVLNGRDIPNTLLDQWPRGATLFLRLRVDERGYVAECSVDRGTGVAAIDSEICNLAHDRLRFRPALNRSGQAVAGWFGYAQPPPG